MAVFPVLFFSEISSPTTFYWMSTVSARCFVVMHKYKSSQRQETQAAVSVLAGAIIWCCSLPQPNREQDHPIVLCSTCCLLPFEQQCLVPSGHWAPAGALGLPWCFNQHLLWLTDLMVSLQGTGRDHTFGTAWGLQPSTPDFSIFLGLV